MLIFARFSKFLRCQFHVENVYSLVISHHSFNQIYFVSHSTPPFPFFVSWFLFLCVLSVSFLTIKYFVALPYHFPPPLASSVFSPLFTCFLVIFLYSSACVFFLLAHASTLDKFHAADMSNHNKHNETLSLDGFLGHLFRCPCNADFLPILFEYLGGISYT